MEDIAIVGLSFRLPGASSLEELWSKLFNKQDCVREFPSHRWSETYFNKSNIISRRAGLLDEKELFHFDGGAFGINGLEAKTLDPQQRMLLQCAWEALEDAGVALSKPEFRKTGVIIGCGYPDFCASASDDADLINPYTQTAQAFSIHSNRISYCFNFTGPSFTVDTACSTGLYAIHLACQSLRSRECDMMVTGAINALLEPNTSVAFSRMGVLSPDGKCKCFDASADGYVRGEGVGIVVLKRLETALKHGDRIYAVIKGSAVNEDGSERAALSTPNKITQMENLYTAYQNSVVKPNDLHYIEMHGTGTKLGDKTETNAVGEALCTSRTKPLYIGSIKSNIGHLEWSAGMASLMKVILQLKHRMLLPNIHFNTPNPEIPFDKFQLKVVTDPIDMREEKETLKMSINSFGFGVVPTKR